MKQNGKEQRIERERHRKRYYERKQRAGACFRQRKETIILYHK